MFSLIRKTLTLVVVAAGSIVLWEAGVLPDAARKHAPRMADKVVSARNLVSRTGEENRKADSDEPAPTEHEDAKGMNTGQRLIVWVLFVLLLPVVTAPLAGGIIDRESNAANVLMLLGYTGLDALAAHVVDLVQVTGVISAILSLIFLLAVFAYNLWICGFVAGLRK